MTNSIVQTFQKFHAKIDELLKQTLELRYGLFGHYYVINYFYILTEIGLKFFIWFYFFNMKKNHSKILKIGSLMGTTDWAIL